MDSPKITTPSSSTLQEIYQQVDQSESQVKDLLRARSCLILASKIQFQDALTYILQEIQFLQEQESRVQRALSALSIVQSIAKQYQRMRSSRLHVDPVTDDVDNELAKEINICTETHDLFSRTQRHIRTVSQELIDFKMSLENNWSDKERALDVEKISVALNADSPLIMWKPGAIIISNEQSTPSDYNDLAQQLLRAAQTYKHKSTELRMNVNDTLDDSIKALRNQASNVDIALFRQIRLTETDLNKLEAKLLQCLNELADTERQMELLRTSTVKLDRGMKLTQTRLDERSLRRNVENCRDSAQLALLEQAKTISDGVSAISAQFDRTKSIRDNLLQRRSQLEKEIMVKRKSLYIDKEVGRSLRAFYPSQTLLLGYQ